MATNPTVAGLAQLRNLNPDLRPTDVSKEITLISPEETTMTTVLASTGRIEKTDFEFKIVEQETQPSFVSVAGVTDDTHFTVSADDALNLAANTPLRADSQTVLYITDVTGLIVTVEGGANALAANQQIAIGARAFEENSSAPSASTWQPTTRTGYQQTYRFAWGSSRWMKLIKTFISETRMVADRRTAFMEAKRTVERGLIHNAARKIAGPPIRYYAGGLYDQNNVNVFDVEDDGTVTYEMFDDFLTSMKNSGVDLWGLCSPETCGVIRKMAWKKSNADTYISDGSFMGVPFTNILCGNKRIKLFQSNHLPGVMKYDLHVLDKTQIKITTTVDQDTGKSQWMMLETDAETPGSDGDLNILTVDFGLWFANRTKHCLIRNIRKAGV
jgi:hypothetical protein